VLPYLYLHFFGGYGYCLSIEFISHIRWVQIEYGFYPDTLDRTKMLERKMSHTLILVSSYVKIKTTECTSLASCCISYD